MTNLDFVVACIEELLEECVESLFAERSVSVPSDPAKAVVSETAGAPEGDGTQDDACPAKGEETPAAPQYPTKAEILEDAHTAAEAIAHRLCKVIPGIRAIVEGPHHIMEAYPTVFLSEAEMIVESAAEESGEMRDDGNERAADMYMMRMDALLAHMHLCRTINEEAGVP